MIARSVHALTARFTPGLSPIAHANACGDWAAYLAFLPAKQMRLAEGPDTWAQRAPLHGGSWWPDWTAWLGAHLGRPVPPPRLARVGDGGRPLPDAPGSCVLEP